MTRPRASTVLLLPVLVPWLLAADVRGQEPEPPAVSAPAPEPAPVALEQELADRLAELEAALEAEAEADRGFEEARRELAGAEDEVDRAANLETAEMALEQARADVASAQKLYDAAAERYRIERESEALERQSADAGGDAGPVPARAGQVLGRRLGELERARQEAELARLQTQGLQEELDALEERRQRNLQAVAEIDERLRGRLARGRRGELAGRRRELEEEERSLAERIEKLRRSLLEAKVAQRLRDDDVARLTASYTRRKRDVLAFVALLAGVLLLQWALRRSAVKQVKEPHRRYQVGKLLSLGAMAIVVVGFVVIFAQDLKQFVTGLGIAIAGLAIAVQELISSFVAWFIIRGTDGYRVGDWIRLGGQDGEVIDIGWLVTVLEQTDPLDSKGETGGARTGALAYVANAAIFKGGPMVNFTRQMPFIWLALRYTVTFESDWRVAERIARQALEAEKEITSTARRARRDLKAASGLAFHGSSTEPCVWVHAAADGVELVVRFLVHPRRRQSLKDALNRRILEGFAAAEEVDFAYRTVRSVSLGPPPALPPGEV